MMKSLMERVPGCTRRPGQLLPVSNKRRGPTRGIGRGTWHSTAEDRIAAEQNADERADKKWEEWRKAAAADRIAAEQRADERAEKTAKRWKLIAIIYFIGWLVAPFLPGIVFPPS